MKTWILSSWDALRTNFWFVPSLMVAASVLLSVATLGLDHRLGPDETAAIALTYSRGPEGARALLSTVAGSMVTIASLTFSITIVTLQLASSQFGPRLLRNFVRDRGNQVVLGTFIATFTYCLLILRTVNGTEEHEFVPDLSVLAAMLLTLASLAVLIYFIHHTSYSIQAETVIDAVGRDLHGAIDRLFPESIGRAPDDPAPAAALPEGFEAGSRPVPSARSDYIQAVDGGRLLDLAARHDLVLRTEHRPGDFVVEGQALARAWPAARLDDALAGEIRGAFYFGSRRTLTQDVEFAVDQLVEVALRALSPGINDPFTAISCVDRLGAALAHLSGRQVPSAYRVDEDGRLRVVAEAVSVSGIVDAAFHQVRQAARANAAVTLRLLETIAALLPFARDPALRAALLRHASLIHDESQSGLPAPSDRLEATARYQAVLAVASGGPDTPAAS